MVRGEWRVQVTLTTCCFQVLQQPELNHLGRVEMVDFYSISDGGDVITATQPSLIQGSQIRPF